MFVMQQCIDPKITKKSFYCIYLESFTCNTSSIKIEYFPPERYSNRRTSYLNANYSTYNSTYIKSVHYSKLNLNLVI